MNNSAFYEKVVALDSDTHRNLKFDAAKVNFAFARHCTAMAITCAEFARAAQEYPIAFIRGDDRQLRPVVMLGVQDAENLFVNSAGLWDAVYIPLAVQHYPFVMAEGYQPDQLCIDETCAALNLETGELLIDAEGKPQQRMSDELQFLHDFQLEMAQTGLMVNQLDELDLFVRFVTTGGENFQLNDFFLIDDAKFKLVADEKLPALFHSGALRLAYLHIASLDNMPRLSSRAISRSTALKAGVGKEALPQDSIIPRKPDQGMQKPKLKSKLNDDLPPLILLAGQQEQQRKQDVVKKLSDEMNRLAQEHKERYAQGAVEADLAAVATARENTKSDKRSVPGWAWGLVVMVLTGVAIFWATSEKKRDVLPTPVTARAPTVPQPASDTDPFAAAMIRISPGNFEMGSINGDADEKPVQHVNISHAFEMAKTEVTQGQWKAVMGNLPDKLHFKQCGDNCPVESVSWKDAQEFIIKLNARSGKQYRLPSEAEWEYACRAGGTHHYCGGNNLDSVAWYGNDKAGKTPHAVAGKQPNAWGLYDMSGNVWEWVEDCYRDRYSAQQADGRTSCDARVLRGGSWSNEADTPRAANRYRRVAKDRFNNNGFRLARGL